MDRDSKNYSHASILWWYSSFKLTIKHILVLGTVLGVLGNNKSQVNGHLINKQKAIVGEGVPEYDGLVNGKFVQITKIFARKRNNS